jgi:aminopeptidase
MDIRDQKLAQLITEYSVNVQPGDKVVIRGGVPAEPLIKELYKAVLAAGGHPILWTELPWESEILLGSGTEEQYTYIHKPIEEFYAHYDRLIRVLAEDNTKNLNGVDSDVYTRFTQSRAPLMNTYMDRTAKGELRWALTLYPTNAYAQDADMSLDDYADFVYRACMPDQNDPVGYWRGVSERQERIIKWLKGKKNVHLLGKGTDLRLSIEGRNFINCDCRLNIPDGEIFTGPVEDSMEGHVTFSYPTIYHGREVTGVQLDFKKGRVVKASAEKNEEFLLKTIDVDEGGRGVGEFAIGTNEGIQQFTRQILFDEKIGGSFHMALGKGYPESGSVAQSAIHWDMICDLRDGGQIWVDDQLLYENGKFVIEG